MLRIILTLSLWVLVSGLAHADFAGGTSTVSCPPKVANDTRFYPILGQCVTGGGSAGVTPGVVLAAGTAYCVPVYLQRPEHWDQVAVTITTLGTSNLQIATYNDTIVSSLHQPGTNIAATANIVDTSTGTVTGALGTNGVGVAIPTGLSWLCYQANDTSVIFDNSAASGLAIANLIGTATAANATTGTNVNALKVTNTFGTWGSLAGASFTDALGFNIAAAYRLVSIP